ncbi:MAG: glycosyltransferase family 4 protein [Pedobacter sp.]|uniref:glycosyltransferase family 4 protein n=1 Tax=Pedobacter sp. TaxID=1411316 RepID=UPI003391D170
MKILVVHTYYKLKGGEDSVVANEIKLLRAAGMEVEQLSFSNSGSTLSKLVQVPFNWGSYRTALRKVEQFHPDVVHIHNLHFSGSAAVVYAIKKLKVPIVMTLHNYRLLCPSGSLYYDNQLFLDSLKPGMAWQAVKKGVYQNSKAITFWIAAAAYLHEKLGTWKKIDRFILLGQHSKDLFAGSKLGELASRMVVKPNFCFSLAGGPIGTAGKVKTAVESSAGALQKQSYYLYVGRLTEEKGLPVLLKAFAASGHALKIVGTGPLEELVKDYSNRHANISFCGARSQEQVYQLLKAATALIFPSVWYETFGMVVIEAFSNGVPVIASDLGNIKNMVTDGFNGLRFTAGDDNDLREKIGYFDALTMEEKNRFGSNARQTYESQYSPETNAAQLIELYQAVIPGRNDPQAGGNRVVLNNQ